MSFTARTTSPSTSNKYYKHTSAGGVNECILISNGSVLPNCTGYAWGRFYEISGKRPKLSRRNAELWYGYTADGYKRGKTPKVGAVCCWAKGKVGNSSDGAGHVAIVEKVYKDGSFMVSQSGYSSKKRFWTSKIPANGYLKGYTFQGFIYNPTVSSSSSTTSSSSSTGYVKGKNYTLLTNVKVRQGAGTKYAQKTVNQLSKDGKKHATSTNSKAPAVLKKGTVVTSQAVVKSGSDVWLKIPSGYVCAKKGSEVYIK